MDTTTNHLAGMAAEQIVARIYMDKGYSLRHTRWRVMGGELDLVLQQNDCLIFCEVKKSKSFEAAAMRVTDQKQARILNTANAYLAAFGFDQSADMRFDVALVDGTGNTHILENALI